MSEDEGRAEGDSSRERILASAVQEFADHGLAGARVDRIAARAGANKQLIYYYFGSKDGLFDAAVRLVAQRSLQPPDSGDRLEDRLVAWADELAADPAAVRFLAFEGLGGAGEALVDEEERRTAAKAAVAAIRKEQREGRLPSSIDAGQLLLSLQALVAHPYAFPQISRLVTGQEPSSAKFRRDRAALLRWIGGLLEREARSEKRRKP